MNEERAEIAEDLLNAADYLKEQLDSDNPEIYESRWLDPIMVAHGALLAEDANFIESATAAREIIIKHFGSINEWVDIDFCEGLIADIAQAIAAKGRIKPHDG